MAIHESGEDYLETILVLHKKTGFVRSVDIANELQYSKPSVSRAMSILKDGGFIICRFSGTEPLLRIFAESSTKEAAQESIDKFAEFLGL